MNFKNWQIYKDECKELNLYIKSYLKELGLKPKKDAVSEVHKVYTGGRWKQFEFFKLEDTEQIRKRNKCTIRELENNPKNICKSLYVVNKSAKKSRDTKQENYYKRNYGIVSKAKDRQNNLYELKNNVIEKMIEENLLTLKGYHIQNLDTKIYLLLYTFDNYSFHVLSKKEEAEKFNYLGEINDKISAEPKIKTDIKYNEAVKLLNDYLNKE